MNNLLVTSPDGRQLPPLLRDLTAVAVARLELNGVVIESNRGFALLSGHSLEEIDGADVRSQFVNPDFSELLAGVVDKGEHLLFQGIMTFGDTQTNNRSVHGALYQKKGELWFVAEHSIDDLERINSTVIDLNNELAQTQRDLVKSNNALKRKEVEITHLMLTDTLTDIPNRRYFETEAAREFARADRSTSDLSIAICDIDHFKSVNDSFGHEVGDIVLTRVARCISDTVRKSDFTARWGGEEFVIMFADSDSSAAELTAERVRMAVSKIWFEEMESSITISIGISQRLPDDSLVDIMKRADQALYRSKEMGRNRTTIE